MNKLLHLRFQNGKSYGKVMTVDNSEPEFGTTGEMLE